MNALTSLSDEELLARYASGEAAAFGVLFDRHHGPIYRLARAMLRDAQLAEDALQETFLAVARAASRFEPRARFATWISRIARNRCLDLVGARQRRERPAEQPTLRLLGTVPAVGPTPHERLEGDERLRCVRERIETLPDRQREAIALLSLVGLRYREIAAVMALPSGTVKTLIHRARATLARALEEDPRCDVR